MDLRSTEGHALPEAIHPSAGSRAADDRKTHPPSMPKKPKHKAVKIAGIFTREEIAGKAR